SRNRLLLQNTRPGNHLKQMQIVTATRRNFFPDLVTGFGTVSRLVWCRPAGGSRIAWATIRGHGRSVFLFRLVGKRRERVVVATRGGGRRGGGDPAAGDLSRLTGPEG